MRSSGFKKIPNRMLRKLFFIVATTFFAASTASAADHIITSDSCFAHIDSNLYVVADHMPRYTEEVYVGDINPAGYDVELCYPEFKALSGKDLRAIRELQKCGVVANDAEIDASGIRLCPSPAPTGGLDLEQRMLIDRKKGALIVSFCPIVRHEGQWKRIVSCQVKVAARTDSRSGAPRRAQSAEERWATSSVLANGKWAKISVTKEGIYQLTADDLKKMGFDDPAKVRVYGYGGRIQDEQFLFPAPDETVYQTATPDDLVEVPVYATSDNRLLFWAEGTMRYDWAKNDKSTSKYTHTQNHYSTESYYFVTESNDKREAIAQLAEVAGGAATEMTTVPYVSVVDNDCCNFYEGGRRMFDEHNFATGSSKSFRLETPDMDMESGLYKCLDVSAAASHPTNSTSFKVTLADVSLGSFTVSNYDPKSQVAKVSTESFDRLDKIQNAESLILQVSSSSGHPSYVDYARLNYPRKLQAQAVPYSFSPQQEGPVRLLIANANDKVHLWRIGQFGSPTAEVPATLNADGQLVATVGVGTRRYVFFDESKTFSAPTYVGAVDNQNLHADSNIDYVIIIPANGKVADQAERLGQIHQQHDGLTYKVVRADQLYNEFSSGTPDANAYRRYLKMLYDRAGSDADAMPRFCLFMGKGLWDNRFLTTEFKGKKADDYLLVYESESYKQANAIGSVDCYATDDFFGLLDDGEGSKTSIESDRVDLALGRMVCMNDEEAKLLVDKVEAYINNTDNGSWKNTIAMLGDNGDKNEHMNDSEKVADEILAVAPNCNLQRVYWDRYNWTSSAIGYTFPQATARIRQLMTEGALMFNYSGHGSPTTISHYKVLQLPDFKQAFSPHMSLWVLASCEIYPFDHEEDNLAESALYLPTGGAIAFICATRSVYAQYNNPFNRAYCRYVFSKKEDGKLYSFGEALSKAKNTISINQSDKTINRLKYICFGDPALCLSLPTGNVVADAINGQSISELKEPLVLKAGEVVTISGHVSQIGDPSSIDTTFDGHVSATIYDREQQVICKNNMGEKTSDGSSLITPMVFSERDKSIFKGTTKAQDGLFTFTLVVPRDISYSTDSGRIILYAVSSDRTREYSGCTEMFCLNGTAETEIDENGPEVFAYINSVDNPDYTITDEHPVLIADIRDDYGINNAGISLGHDIELVIDGNTTNCINLNSYFNYDLGSYQKGQLVYEMNNMERGPHTAQLRVWDVNNNITITDVHFIVRSENAVGGRDGYVTATKNPAATDTRFITYFPADAEVEGLVLYEVYDTRGRCVYKESVAAPAGSSSASLSWDLCGNDHQPLPSGVYFYRTVVNTNNGSKATDAQKLIITRQ